MLKSIVDGGAHSRPREWLQLGGSYNEGVPPLPYPPLAWNFAALRGFHGTSMGGTEDYGAD